MNICVGAPSLDEVEIERAMQRRRLLCRRSNHFLTSDTKNTIEVREIRKTKSERKKKTQEFNTEIKDENLYGCSNFDLV